jgi:hypothetical protein
MATTESSKSVPETESLTLHVAPPAGLFGRTATLTVSPTMTIRDFKTLACGEIKVRANNAVFCYLDGYLDNNETFADYDIPNDATLTYHVRLCGPLPVDVDWGSVGYKKLSTNNNNKKHKI